MFVMQITIKGLSSRIYKEQIIQKKENWVKDKNKKFIKETTWVTNNHEKILTFLLIKRMQIKAIVCYYLTVITLTKILKADYLKSYQGCENSKTLIQWLMSNQVVDLLSLTKIQQFHI